MVVIFTKQYEINLRKPLNDKGSLKLSLAAKFITKGVDFIFILGKKLQWIN